jgi:hypothetical protein
MVDAAQPSGSDSIKVTPPPTVRVNPSPNQGTGTTEGTLTSDEFVTSPVQGVTTQPAAPARESLASTVSNALSRILSRDVSRGQINPQAAKAANQRALEILGIDEPGGPITSA